MAEGSSVELQLSIVLQEYCGDESSQASPDFSCVVGFGAKNTPCRQPRSIADDISASFPSNCR